MARVWQADSAVTITVGWVATAGGDTARTTGPEPGPGWQITDLGPSGQLGWPDTGAPMANEPTYPSGPDATTRATAQALTRLEDAARAILVEGISDQMAVELAAERLGRDLRAEGQVVVPVGGAGGLARQCRELGPHGLGLPLGGLCDAGEAPLMWRALIEAGLATEPDLGRPDADRASWMAWGAEHGFHVCVDDLEHELIRAAGPQLVIDLVRDFGELRSLQTFQSQPAWHDRPIDQQLHRFLRSQSSRKHRYVPALVGAIDLASLPEPLVSVVNWG